MRSIVYSLPTTTKSFYIYGRFQKTWLIHPRRCRYKTSGIPTLSHIFYRLEVSQTSVFTRPTFKFGTRPDFWDRRYARTKVLFESFGQRIPFKLYRIMIFCCDFQIKHHEKQAALCGLPAVGHCWLLGWIQTDPHKANSCIHHCGELSAPRNKVLFVAIQLAASLISWWGHPPRQRLIHRSCWFVILASTLSRVNICWREPSTSGWDEHFHLLTFTRSAVERTDSDYSSHAYFPTIWIMYYQSNRDRIQPIGRGFVHNSCVQRPDVESLHLHPRLQNHVQYHDTDEK